MPKKSITEAMFWERVNICNPDSCWEWTRSRSKSGHGMIHFQKTHTGTHRVAYRFYYGEIPEGLCVLHSCDNPPCCNPRHLHLGTKSDNSKEAYDRKRWIPPAICGEDHWSSDLKDADIINIRNLYCSGTTQTELSLMYKITVSEISMIVNGKRWSHLSYKETGFSRSGENNHSAKLTPFSVSEIRKKYLSRESSAKSLSKEYGVTETNIRDVANRRTWKHIP